MKSIFAPYKPDTQSMLDKCFEIDWESSKIPKLIKGPGQDEIVKAYLKSIYQTIRETYKYYSGISPLGRVACIGSSVLTEILNNCNDFIDGKTLKLPDVDLQAIACNGGAKSTNWLKPDKALVRCQLMEVLVRLALDKFFKTKIAASHSEAIQMAFEKHLLPFMA